MWGRVGEGGVCVRVCYVCVCLCVCVYVRMCVVWELRTVSIFVSLGTRQKLNLENETSFPIFRLDKNVLLLIISRSKF